MDELTARFYQDHALRYAQATRAIAMDACYARFEAHLKNGAAILDVGAGSGRDMLHFMRAGYAVVGIDASGAMAEQAAIHTGLPVAPITVQRLVVAMPFDGIWANAVLHHLDGGERKLALHRMADALAVDGILFIAVRTGFSFARHADGRAFHGLGRAELETDMRGLPLRVLECWEEQDRVEGGASACWLYALLQRSAVADSIE
jgi:SAM-dependent methyltransferase